MKFSKLIRDVLWGDPFDGAPGRPDPNPPTYDGRTAALKIFRQYLSEITFYRPGGTDQDTGIELPPIAFKIPLRDIHIEWPDDESELREPAIALLSQASADYDSIGLTNNVDEGTENQFGENTVVIWQGEYIEEFALEIWAATKQQRRSMLAGIEKYLSPLQQMAGIRFRMPDYYDQLCCFALQTREIIDDEVAQFARRKARMVIQLRYNVVSLVNSIDAEPSVATNVDVNERTGEPVTLADVDKPGDTKPKDPSVDDPTSS